MATDTANVIAGMRRTGEVCMLVAVGVTAEATLVRIRHTQVLEYDDLALVASPFHMCLPRTVAGLAIHPFAWRAGLKSHLVVRRSFHRLVDVLMAPLAGFRTHVLPGILALACGLLHVSRLHRTRSYEQEGHVEIDFGLDSPFLQEGVTLTGQAEGKLRSNVQKLIEFTAKVEKNSGASARLLWSASDESLAQKLVSRLQKVQ